VRFGPAKIIDRVAGLERDIPPPYGLRSRKSGGLAGNLLAAENGDATWVIMPDKARYP
jgi:hypothetical protein